MSQWLRAAGLAAAVLMIPLPGISAAEATCKVGSEECPRDLVFHRGEITVTGVGTVTGKEPVYYFRFNADKGQMATIHIVSGHGLKTGPGIPFTYQGGGDAFDVDTPMALPVTGPYVLAINANLMSEGPFGPFRFTLTIK